jgi:alpha-L-rhamnosidase
VSHGWSSTPTRDLLVRTLGVTPAEPGFARARVAPRLGDLSWARGAVPTPRGLLRVEAHEARVSVESPVPFDLDLGDGAATRQDPGRVSRVRGQTPF